MPLSYLFLPADAPVPSFGTLLLALLAGDIGLAALGALVAAVASAVRGREVMVPLLFLPAAVPLLIACAGLQRARGRRRRASCDPWRWCSSTMPSSACSHTPCASTR